ncbi:hypothetical protein L596_018580 [Steinernema carpocapsae]|uniref:Uncharacterized protein n=1 Tax=Steinernema carpocapsae TaxID=34508 RepID=A0A4U5N5J0_STECR|nr:hypothetical protein L596_018580 [Steinernema carpocapsae]
MSSPVLASRSGDHVTLIDGQDNAAISRVDTIAFVVVVAWPDRPIWSCASAAAAQTISTLTTTSRPLSVQKRACSRFVCFCFSLSPFEPRIRPPARVFLRLAADHPADCLIFNPNGTECFRYRKQHRVSDVGARGGRSKSRFHADPLQFSEVRGVSSPGRFRRCFVFVLRQPVAAAAANGASKTRECVGKCLVSSD